MGEKTWYLEFVEDTSAKKKKKRVVRGDRWNTIGKNVGNYLNQMLGTWRFIIVFSLLLMYIWEFL